MTVAQKLIRLASRLPARERKKLVTALQKSLDEERSHPGPRAPRTRAAGRRQGPYERTLELAGSVVTDVSDLSADKYKYLGEAYSPRE